MIFGINATLELTNSEKDSLETAYNVFHSLMDKVSKENRIISVETGEVIEGEEFARMCGIIDGIIYNSSWVIS